MTGFPGIKSARFIVFLIDTKHKGHHGKIFCLLKDAREYAKDCINEKDADKAVVGMFVWSEMGNMTISHVETIGFRGDKKRTNQLDLFKRQSL
jgi:hypothetical protein